MLKLRTYATGAIASASCAGYLRAGITNQNSFLIPLLLSSYCTNASWLATRGFHQGLSSFCLCSVPPPSSWSHPAGNRAGEVAQRCQGWQMEPPPNTSLLLGARKAHGHRKHLSGLQTLAFNTSPYILYHIKKSFSKMKWPPQFLCTTSNQRAKSEMGIFFFLSLSLDFTCCIFVNYKTRFVTKQI